MSVRAIQARIQCDRSLPDHLWRTHRVFNERLPRILSFLFKMRRGECGRSNEERGLYQEIARFILARNSKDAPYLLNSVSIKDWTPNTAKKMKAKTAGSNGGQIELSGADRADRAAKLSKHGALLYDKAEVLGDLPDSLRQMVVRECAAIIRGHDELVENWNEDHAKWVGRKQDWENNGGRSA
jgi:hypothetical protein